MDRRTLTGALALAPLAIAMGGRALAASDEQFPIARSYLKSMIGDAQFNGVALLIHREGRSPFAFTAGTLDGLDGAPMRTDSICALASMTKPLTGVATLVLVEDGKLALDASVDRWLPELADRKVLRRPDGPLDDVVPSPRSITVHDLLSFRCGYGADGPRGPYSDALRAAYGGAKGSLTNDQFLAALKSLPLQYAPGVTWLYDTPANILGVLIARVSGKSFGEFLNERVTGPLGMTDTAFTVPEAKRTRLAQLPPAVAKPFSAPLFESGGAGLYSTANDYMKFCRMLLNGGSLDGVRILSRERVAGMAVDTLTPAEHVAGSFIARYPRRGYGQTLAVRTDPLPIGPSLGSINWAGATGVWFMIDRARKMIIVAMVQHPGGGPPNAALGQAQPPGAKVYVEQRAWNDALQLAIYKDA